MLFVVPFLNWRHQMYLSSLEYHTLGGWFRPLRAFFNLQTLVYHPKYENIWSSSSFMDFTWFLSSWAYNTNIFSTCYMKVVACIYLLFLTGVFESPIIYAFPALTTWEFVELFLLCADCDSKSTSVSVLLSLLKLSSFKLWSEVDIKIFYILKCH